MVLFAWVELRLACARYHGCHLPDDSGWHAPCGTTGSRMARRTTDPQLSQVEAVLHRLQGFEAEPGPATDRPPHPTAIQAAARDHCRMDRHSGRDGRPARGGLPVRPRHQDLAPIRPGQPSRRARTSASGRSPAQRGLQQTAPQRPDPAAPDVSHAGKDTALMARGRCGGADACFLADAPRRGVGLRAGSYDPKTCSAGCRPMPPGREGGDTLVLRLVCHGVRTAWSPSVSLRRGRLDARSRRVRPSPHRDRPRQQRHRGFRRSPRRLPAPRKPPTLPSGGEDDPAPPCTTRLFSSASWLDFRSRPPAASTALPPAARAHHPSCCSGG